VVTDDHLDATIVLGIVQTGRQEEARDQSAFDPKNAPFHGLS